MQSIKEVATKIVEELAPHRVGTDKINAVDQVTMRMTYLMQDTLTLIKNINDTSLVGTNDRTVRFDDMELKFGIPVKYIR